MCTGLIVSLLNTAHNSKPQTIQNTRLEAIKNNIKKRTQTKHVERYIVFNHFVSNYKFVVLTPFLVVGFQQVFLY